MLLTLIVKLGGYVFSKPFHKITVQINFRFATNMRKHKEYSCEKLPWRKTKKQNQKNLLCASLSQFPWHLN